MNRSRVLRGIIAVAFCLTFVSAVRADSAHGENLMIEKRIFAERYLDLSLNDDQRVIGYLYAGHFENNNGKHLGFSMASVRQGQRFSLVTSPKTPPSVTENPEPTAMVLLGTGLAAIGAFARKLKRRRKA